MQPHFFSREYRTADIPLKGVEGRLIATPGQRAAIADALDLASLDAFSFDYHLRRSGKDRFKLDGKLEAHLMQACVVTLEPVEAQIREEIDLEFWPADEVARLEAQDQSNETEIGLEGPEPIDGDVIDIGQLAYETLASGIDPYPRKPGVEFDAEASPDDSGEASADSPFSVLRSLRPADD